MNTLPLPVTTYQLEVMADRARRAGQEELGAILMAASEALRSGPEEVVELFELTGEWIAGKLGTTLDQITDAPDEPPPPRLVR